MDESDRNPHRRRPRYPGTHPRRFDQRYKELHPEAYPQMQEHIRDAGRTPAGTHVPILVPEVLACLQPAPGQIVADCTVGYGGHAMEFLRRIAPDGRLVGFDVDANELERTRVRLSEFVAGLDLPAGTARPAVHLHHGNFAGVANVLAAEGIDGYDIVFADLGVSSMQVDDPARGFSYKLDGPLDMRMDHRTKRTAADLLAALSSEEFSRALEELADEEDHEEIARRIVQRRSGRPILTTLDLAGVAFQAKGLSRRDWRRQAGPGAPHPAARTFQALRILVNDELGCLRQLLRMAPLCLRAGGRIGVLSFHSGEDRVVKKAFQEGLDAGAYREVCDEVVRPGPAEIASNPRSASAKFRWARTPVTPGH